LTLDIGRTAFRGFTIVGQKPWLVLVWGLAYILAFALVAGLTVGLVMAMGANFTAPTTPEAIRAEPIMAMVAVIPVATAGFLFLYAVFLCAAYRMVLRPEESAFGYLRIGMAELRLTGVLLLSVLMWLLLYFGVALVVTFVGVATLGIGLILWLPALALFVWLSVKLSLTAVVNFAEGKVGFSESWRLTRNNFWNLFLVYLILFAIMMVISIVLFALQSATQSMAGVPSIFDRLQPGAAPAGFTSATGPTGILIAIVGLVINLFVTAANLIFMYAPHAEAYLQLKPRPADKTSEVFA
jgi:hypothetical protein